jgi:selenocysteine-specific elongation factor
MYFEAVLDLNVQEESFDRMGTVLIFKGKTSASVDFYKPAEDKPEEHFVRICAGDRIQVKWRDEFELRDLKSKKLIARGKVLVPEAGDTIPGNLEKKIAFLKQLNKKEEDMIFALAEKKGLQGLSQQDILDFSRLSKKQILDVCQSLEKEKKIRIVSFSPVLIISRFHFDLLKKKILSLVRDHSKSDPERKGVDLEEIMEQVDAYPKVVELAVSYLKYLGRINEYDRKFTLSSPEESITKEDERIIRKMNDMCSAGEFKNYSFEELPNLFGISAERFDRLFDILLARKKVVHGKDGFIFFSDWLDQLIAKLQESGVKELTVSEFKKISGLSRKYAIPLLELLDKKGVTRKQGSLHKIL